MQDNVEKTFEKYKLALIFIVIIVLIGFIIGGWFETHPDENIPQFINYLLYLYTLFLLLTPIILTKLIYKKLKKNGRTK